MLLQPGTFWDGDTKGKVAKLGGLEAYISEPSQNSGRAVVLLPDVFGESDGPTDLCTEAL